MEGRTSINREPMLEMFIFETNQLLEQLEGILINSDKNDALFSEDADEIFRIMHAIKGSAAMMMFDNISSLANAVEDLIYFIREKKPSNLDYSTIYDLVLASSDFIKLEISKIEDGKDSDGNGIEIIDKIKSYLSKLSGTNECNEESTLKAVNDTSRTQQDSSKEAFNNAKQNLISVNATKLDKLMDLVGEIVIVESMVTKNPDLEGLQLDNFNKTSRQLRELTGELQDTVMSIHMVPVCSIAEDAEDCKVYEQKAKQRKAKLIMGRIRKLIKI